MPRQVQQTNIPQKPWRQTETVSNVVFFLSKLFLHYTLGTFGANISVILLCWSHNPTMITIEGKIWSNISKHATVAE